jgi:hypothetical protein
MGEATYSAGAGQVEGIAHAMTVAFLLIQEPGQPRPCAASRFGVAACLASLVALVAAAPGRLESSSFASTNKAALR